MKIGFISPRSSFYYRNEEKNRTLKELPGFSIHTNSWSGIGTALPILASLTPDNYDVEIIDENVEEINFDKNYDLVAVTCMTHQAIRAYQICSEFKKRGVYTVIGGIHPFIMYEESSHFADTVVVGEAETIWPTLLIDFVTGKIKKFYFQKDYPKTNLEELPIPRYDLLKEKNYPIIWLNFSRGCPYDCEFCSVTNLFGKNYRHKKEKQILDEVLYIQKTFKKILIGFSDDNMFIDRKFSKNLLKEFTGLNFRWVCQSDITIANDPELLKLLYNAGCHLVYVGFESLDSENLDHIYDKGKKLKRDNLSNFKGMIAEIQKNGVGVFGSFILGLDNDTKDTFKTVTDFIDDSNMYFAFLNILTPLPGTRLRERLLKDNRVIPTSWDNYTNLDVNFVPKNLTYKEIEDGVFEAYKKIYSVERVKKVINYFKEIYRNLNQ